MCGTFVRVRRCSSASLGSGTARKRASMADSSVALRNPKIEIEEGGGFPTFEPADIKADERRAMATSFIEGAKLVRYDTYSASAPEAQNLHDREHRGNHRCLSNLAGSDNLVFRRGQLG